MDQDSPQPIRCRAAVCRKTGEPLVIEEIIVAPPSHHEVWIRIICTSLCHRDIIFWQLKDPPACFPRILGHEAIGNWSWTSLSPMISDFEEINKVFGLLIKGDCIRCVIWM